MLERMKRAALLDAHAYEEVEADRGATGQAAAVVAIVAVSQGIGVRFVLAIQVLVAGILSLLVIVAARAGGLIAKRSWSAGWPRCHDGPMGHGGRLARTEMVGPFRFVVCI